MAENEAVGERFLRFHALYREVLNDEFDALEFVEDDFYAFQVLDRAFRSSDQELRNLAAHLQTQREAEMETITLKATEILESTRRLQTLPQKTLSVSADFVLGDCHGQACAQGLTDAAEKHLRDAGFVVARNEPYAGGYITRHYGKPANGHHALQIEINRGLYMDEARIARAAGFDKLRDALTALIAALACIAPTLPGPQA